MVTDPEVTRILPPGPAPTLQQAQRVIGERQAMERGLKKYIAARAWWKPPLTS